MVPLDDCDTATKYHHLGRPQKVALATLTKPAELVHPATITKSLLTDEMYIGDFGFAAKGGIDSQAIKDWRSPVEFCAPELYHKASASFASDMWSYMCIFAQLYLGHFIFPSGIHSNMRVLGSLPEQWKGLIEGSKEEWYDQSRTVDTKAQIERRIDRLVPNADHTKRSHAISILMRGFRYLPEERFTATQLLQDQSFKALTEI